MLSLLPPHQEELTDCPACSKLTADEAFSDFTGMLIVIEVAITRQSYLIGDMSNKQSHNQAWWRWTIDNFAGHGFKVDYLLPITAAGRLAVCFRLCKAETAVWHQ